MNVGDGAVGMGAVPTTPHIIASWPERRAITMAEGDLHSYVCDDSSQESASDSEDFLEGKLIWAYVVLGQNWGTPEIIVLSKLW